ncbi:MAG: DUF2157 domain-containing protein [Magnetococcales bacterium]|nr:DUF2157 domain-containing protein [Magnetococcales bacterium]
MRKLDNMLNDWVKLGLIDPDQKNAIVKFEASRLVGGWMQYSFIALGTTVIGIGVIAVVAANWMQIADYIKLVVDFLLLLGLGVGVLYFYRRENIPLLETFLALFILFCMASIGLISQIYHTGGRLEDALIFWAVITLPVVTLSRHHFIPFLWVAIFFSAVVVRIVEQKLFFPNISEENRWLALLMVLPFFAALLSTALAKNKLLAPIGLGFRRWSFISGGVGVFVFDVTINFNFSSSYRQLTEVFGLVSLIGLPVIALVWWFSPLVKKRKKIVLAIMMLYLGTLPIASQLPQFEIIGAIFTIIILTLSAVYAGLADNQRLLTLLMLLVGLRFLAVYFEALGGLALSGIGLIVSGGIILGGVYLWNKNKSLFQKWIMGLEQ